ncbi:hypothetical protein G6F43_012189 [Rhizopus delemar]|nr:hypothetical protein G6F43_012189 [Rhizopus delemar]
MNRKGKQLERRSVRLSSHEPINYNVKEAFVHKITPTQPEQSVIAESSKGAIVRSMEEDYKKQKTSITLEYSSTEGTPEKEEEKYLTEIDADQEDRFTDETSYTDETPITNDNEDKKNVKGSKQEGKTRNKKKKKKMGQEQKTEQHPEKEIPKRGRGRPRKYEKKTWKNKKPTTEVIKRERTSSFSENKESLAKFNNDKERDKFTLHTEEGDDSKEDDSKEDDSKEDDSKEDGSKEDGIKEDDSKEDDSKEDDSKVTCNRESSVECNVDLDFLEHSDDSQEEKKSLPTAEKLKCYPSGKRILPKCSPSECSLNQKKRALNFRYLSNLRKIDWDHVELETADVLFPTRIESRIEELAEPGELFSDMESGDEEDEEDSEVETDGEDDSSEYEEEEEVVESKESSNDRKQVEVHDANTKLEINKEDSENDMEENQIEIKESENDKEDSSEDEESKVNNAEREQEKTSEEQFNLIKEEEDDDLYVTDEEMTAKISKKEKPLFVEALRALNIKAADLAVNKIPFPNLDETALYATGYLLREYIRYFKKKKSRTIKRNARSMIDGDDEQVKQVARAHKRPRKIIQLEEDQNQQETPVTLKDYLRSKQF